MKNEVIEKDLKIEEMVLNMGPSHPAMHGIIRIVLKLSGEFVVDADVEIGYLHRGFEKEAEDHPWNQVIPYTDRLNYVSPLINNVGYVMAVEKLIGIDVTERCKYIRVIISEISRITDHLTCIAASAMELGAMTAFLYFIKAREYLYDLIEELCGARVTTNYTRIGGLRNDLPDGFSDKLKDIMKEIRKIIVEVDKLLTRNRIFIDRMKGVGKISQEDAISYSITGPFLRSTGVKYDVRKANPYLVYDKINFQVPVGTNGDNYDRYLVRMEEMEQSMLIIEQTLEMIPEGPINVDDKTITLPPKEEVYNNIEALMDHFKLIMPGHGINPPIGEVYFSVEAGNGELGFYIVSDGKDKPYRVRVRPPCFVIMSALASMIKGGFIADIIATFGTVNMIGGELDR